MVWTLSCYRTNAGASNGPSSVELEIGGCELDGVRMALLTIRTPGRSEAEIQLPGDIGRQIGEALMVAYEAANRRDGR